MILFPTNYTLASAAVLLLAAVAPASAQDGALEDITLVLANPSAINILPVWTAIGEGYFAEEVLAVTVEAVNGSASVLQAVVAGQAEIGNPGGPPTLAARARGVDVTFFYNLNPQSAFGIVVEEDNVEIQTPEDLEGRVIGVGTADGAEVTFARTVLAGSGLEEGQDYEFLVVGDGGMATAGFSRDDIDAYAAATSDAAILNARGLAVRNITPDAFRSYFGNGFVAMTSFIDENPDVIEGFGRAVARGSRFASDPGNLDAVLEHTRSGNPQEGEDPAFAAALIQAIIERQTPSNPEGHFGAQEAEDWEAWQTSLLESGELAEPLPDLGAVYTNDFVEAWNAPVPQ